MGLFFNKKPKEPQEVSKVFSVGGSIGEVYVYLRESFGRLVTSPNDGKHIEAVVKIMGQGTIRYLVDVTAMGGTSSRVALRVISDGVDISPAVDDFAKSLRKKFTVSY